MVYSYIYKMKGRTMFGDKMEKNRYTCDFQSDDRDAIYSKNYIDSKTGDVFILGEFDKSISSEVVPGLVKKIRDEAGNPNASIWFYINSPGGYVHELYNLLSLIDIAKQQGIKIYTVVMGEASSCASMLAIHGDHRAIYKNGTHLVHLGCATTAQHTFEQLERNTKHIHEHFDNIVRMYKENTKMSDKQIRKALLDDMCFFNAKECKEYGLVDEIIGEELPVTEVEVTDGMNIEVNGVVVKVKVSDKKKQKDKSVNKQSKTKKIKKQTTKNKEVESTDKETKSVVDEPNKE